VWLSVVAGIRKIRKEQLVLPVEQKTAA